MEVKCLVEIGNTVYYNIFILSERMFSDVLPCIGSYIRLIRRD